jgi:hypothetical protein
LQYTQDQDKDSFVGQEKVMRGIDLTPEQLEAADKFLRGVMKSNPSHVPDDQPCTSRW